MVKKINYESIVHGIYTAATDPEYWPAVLDTMSDYMGAVGANFHILNGQEHFGELSLTNYVDAHDMARWNAEIAPICPWNECLMDKKVGEAYLSHEMVPERQFLASQAYQEFYHRQGCFYTVGSFFAKHDNKIGVIGMNRTREGGRFGVEDVFKLQQFIPHMNRAFLIQEQIASLEQELATASGALNQMASGMALVNEEGGVIFANRAMRAYVESKLFALRGKKILLPAPWQAQLEALIYGCLRAGKSGGSAGGGLSVPVERANGPSTLYFSVFPYRESILQYAEMAQRARAIVYVSEAEPLGVPREVLEGMFGLSERESTVLDLLLRDFTLDEISDALEVGKETTRFHLKNLFSKTGTKRQAQLINLCRSVIGPEAF